MEYNVNDLFNEKLIKKYSTSGPRYTSYPTALEFHNQFSDKDFRKAAVLAVNPDLAIYIHIPFCHSLCYYCGCNKIITRNRDKISRYVRYLIKEITLRAALFRNHQVIQIHFGGGTPSMLGLHELNDLLCTIQESYKVNRMPEISMEIDPREIDTEYIAQIAEAGVNRISLGVQDTNQEVQIAINRVQDTELVANLVNAARSDGIGSVNLDLVYGLPLQNEQRFLQTIKDVKALDPDRVSLFNYAHMPTKFPAQRKIKDNLLPRPEVKFLLMRQAIEQLTMQGYTMIGMDHFAKPNDELAIALQEKRLGRNFQGYTTLRYTDLVGFGVSAISSICNIYSQNLKSPAEYYKKLDEEQNAIERGLVMSNQDQLRGGIIKELMTNMYLDIEEVEETFEIDFRQAFAQELMELKTFIDDDLLAVTDRTMQIQPNARLFARNICMVFDEYMKKHRAAERFSKVI